MCGIIGYIGKRDCAELLIKGLERLEYRGYDSAGLSLLDDGCLIVKTVGKVATLRDKVHDWDSNIGIGHTRWATHGAPSRENAHPHESNNGHIAVVHNGIIENYETLKSLLTEEGFKFWSKTDTEILVNFIQYISDKHGCGIEEAVRLALHQVVGAYAVALMDSREPDRLILAKRSSPLAIGIGDNEYIIASDATPIIEYTKDIVYLEDDTIVTLTKDSLKVTDLNANIQEAKVVQVELEIDEIEKGGFETFMLKEIYEQPRAVKNCFRGRVRAKDGIINMSGVEELSKEILDTNRIIILSCGTSRHAGLIAEYVIEELARIPVEVEYASEFRYRNPIIGPNDIVIAISQSGETADTLAAIKLAKERGAKVFGVVNVVGSSIARLVDSGAYTRCGIEIGVASTKAFTGTLMLLNMVALKLAHYRGHLTDEQLIDYLLELERIPKKIKKALENSQHIERLAKEYYQADNFLYLGRGVNFPVALEGALKLKEISYIHAEGYPAAEMKHGPIALVDDTMPVVFISTMDSSYDKIVSNIEETKARGGKILSIVTEGDIFIKKIVENIIEVPKTCELFTPMLTIIPLQLLAYHIATLRGCDVDKPRNLAKSVTVE